jgi:hypothetical protein
MAHWFTQREHGFSFERAVVADYDLSVMRIDDAAYWLVVRDGRDVAEGEATTPERARWCAEVEAEIAARVRRSPLCSEVYENLRTTRKLGPSNHFSRGR